MVGSEDQYQATFCDSITQIAEQEWNNVLQTDYPFLRYAFLYALESTGAVTMDSGWQPQHLTIYRGKHLVAIMPLYLKFHSYGEYVFDWSWADAYERHGQRYYPKLLSAIPYTPATGPRLSIAANENEEAIRDFAIENLFSHAKKTKVSSIHVLFPEKSFNSSLITAGLSSRRGAQFHWFNQDFQSFEEFLATFTSRKRKNLRKERKNVAAQGLSFTILEGDSIDATMWKTFYSFYQGTYLKRSGHGGYLNQDFFESVAKLMPESLVMIVASEKTPPNKTNTPIAAALFFKGQNTLYGRYWGCIKEVEFLHFETCYYQGIDYCIKNGISKFDPGAQGEHKIQRGFTPIETWSNHWIEDQGFRAAIDDFLNRETDSIGDYIKDCTDLLPFK